MANVWPADDAFTEGAKPYGSYLVGYLCLRINATDYQRGTMYSPVALPGVAVFTAKTPANPDDEPVGVMRREYFVEDSFVSMTSFVGAVQGALSADTVYRQGVAVRVQNGTLGGDKSEFVRLEDVDCYTAEVVRQSAFTFKLQINRYALGVRTTVVETASFNAIGTSFQVAHTTRLSAEQNSGDVDLVATVSGLQTVQYGTGDVTISATDSSGSKITGAGRCGMILDRERTYSSGAVRVVSGATVFEVGATGTGVVAFRDEFTRAFIAAGKVISNEFGFPGFSLASDYSADGQSSFALDATTPDDVAAKREAGLDRVFFSDSDTQNRKIFAVSMRLADDPRVAHREVTARFATLDLSVSAGVVVRGSTNGADIGGYQVRLFTGAAGTGRIAVIRAVVGQNDVGIADVAGLTVIAATPYRIGLEVYPRDGAGVDGPAVIKVYLGGVQQIPTTTITDGSIEILAAGDIIDQGTDVIMSGSLEAFRVSTGSVINAGVSFDTFQQNALTGAEERPEDLPQLTLRREQARKSGTLVLAPDWEVVRVDNQRVESFDTAFGGQTRWALETGQTRQLQLRKLVETADRDTYQTFFDDHKGREIPFDFDLSAFFPHEPTGVWRFLHGEFDRPHMAPGWYSVRMDVEEVL